MDNSTTALDSRTAGLRNEKLVLSVLSDQGDQSQTQLRKLTGLSSSTVCYIVGRLREKGLILEQPGLSSKRGAKPVIVRINPRGRLIVGVEINPSIIFVGLFELTGGLVESVKVPIGSNHDPAAVLDLLEINLRGLLGKHEVAEDKLLGIGITLSGSVGPDGLVHLSSPLGWKQVPLGWMVQERFEASVSVHATRVRLLAEDAIVRSKALANILYINVGNGVGGHVINDGRLLQGATNRSGELGHIVVVPGGPRCGCGNRGCLEALISGPALARKIEADVAAGTDTVLGGALRQGVLPEEVVQAWGRAIHEGDGYALELRDFVAEQLGRVAVIAINCYDPDTVVLAGYVVEQCCGFLIETLQKRFAGEVYDNQDREISIVPAQAGERALIRGVAAAVMRNSLEIA